MEPPIFLVEPDDIHDNIAVLNKAESHHAVKVMRLVQGSIVNLIDGLGCGYRGELLKVGRSKPVEIKIHAQIRNFGEPDIKLTLAAGLSTNYKFDSVIEKGTELGVSRFVPLITEKSKIKIDDPARLKRKQTRYQKVARAAVKQCRRSWIPEISQPMTFEDYMSEIDPNTLNLIFHPGNKSISINELKTPANIKRVNLLVGPESGFSGTEIDLAAENNITSITLGERILRTETAGPVICGIIMHLFGQLR